MPIKLGRGPRTTKINSDGTITVSIPIEYYRRGGKSTIVRADGKEQKKSASLRKLEQDYISHDISHVEMTPMVAAIVKAHKWKEELESGKIKTLTALAEREKINIAYVSRVYRLTLLAPYIIESILMGTQPKTLKLRNMLKPFPMLWTEQRKVFGFNHLKE